MAKTEQKQKQIERPKAVVKAKQDEKSLARRGEARRPRFIQAIVDYFHETIGELRKVSWPTRKEAVNLTIIVIVVMFSMSVVLGLLDFLYTRFFALLFS